MSDRFCGCSLPDEAACVIAKKVYDSCCGRECMRDLRVYFTAGAQNVLDNATGVKPVSAELLWTYVDVEPVMYNDGYYSVGVKYFYKITVDVSASVGCSKRMTGLAACDKRVALFGSTGGVRVFSSEHCGEDGYVGKTNMPVAVVEAAEPVLLGVKLEEDCCDKCCMYRIPEPVCCCFDDDIVPGRGGKALVASIGQFSVIRLVREVPMVVRAREAELAEYKCDDISEEDPCELFGRFGFPKGDFIPPGKKHGSCKAVEHNCGCGCGKSKK